MNYKICVYIPGINYTSSGPGFIDAIKLEAIDTQNRNKTYKVKSVFTDNSSDDESVIFRTTVEPDQKSENTRSSYGYFYDYVVSQTEKKEFNHTLTCFPDIEELQSLKSFDQNTKDGIFYVEIDKEDALVELNFTFYTLSYDQYKQDTNGNDVEKPIVPGSLDNFIIIGKLKNIIRASNLITDEAAEIVGDEALNMYYDITRETKDSDKLYLPVGEDFVPIRGLDGELPKQLKMGDDIFSDYQPESIEWGKPKVFNVPVNEDKTTVIAEDIAYCGYAVMEGTLRKDGQYSSTKDWFSPPTPVHIAKRNTKSDEFNITLSTSSYKFDNIDVLWKNPINIVVQNTTYMEKFQEGMDEYKYFSPISILEFVPELRSIDITEEDITFDWSGFTNDENDTQNITGNASVLGRVFSNALYEMPYAEYSIMPYINNFEKTGKTDEGTVFIYRPDYMKNDIKFEAMMFKKDPSVMINANTMSSVLQLEEYSINPDSDFYDLQIHGSKKSKETGIYPLNVYFNSKNPSSQIYDKDTTLQHISAGTLESKVPVNYNIEERLNYYQHVFTLEDLRNVSTIFGENKIYLTDTTLSMKLNVQTSYPIIQFYQRWSDGSIVTGSGFSDAVTSSPAHVYHPINELNKMIRWAQEQCSENKLITSIAAAGTSSVFKAYDPKLIISPMLAIDMDKSNTVITNKGDYKVIPAYYYGDCSGSSNEVLTDYKKQKCNIDLTSRQFVAFNKDAQKVTVVIPEGIDPISEESNYKHAICSTFQTPDVYLLSNTYIRQKYYIQDLQLSNSKLTPGIYVIKFHKYLENNDIKLNGVKIEYSIKFGETQLCSNRTTEKDFIALYVSKEIEDEADAQLSITIKNPEDSKIIVGNFALYKVDIDDQKSLNSMVLKTWCSTYQADKNVKYIPETEVGVYNNIIFPSAICVYEKFSLLQKPVYLDDNNKYRKDYLSLYLPNKVTEGGNAASIYSIIGMYNIQDVKITQLKELPDDMLEDEKNKIINKIIRYV